MLKVKDKQVDIAEEIGVSQGTISNWLNLRTKPTGVAKKLLEQKFPTLAQRLEAAWRAKNSTM